MSNETPEQKPLQDNAFVESTEEKNLKLDVPLEYFRLLKETSDKTNEFVRNKIKSFGHLGHSRNAILFQEVLRLPEARKNKNILRAVLTELVYRNLGGSARDIIPALALSEINNCNAYLDNWILDDKKQIWSGGDTRETVSRITLASGIFRELLDEVVMDLDTSDSNKLLIIKILSQAMARSYQGQELDLRMTIDNLDSYDDQSYFRSYIRKSMLQSGYLYGVSTEIGAILAEASEDSRLLAKKIGETIGTGLHISNDLGDFAIFDTEGGDFKNYQDQMADLKNGRLSLPVYYALKNGTKEDRLAILKIVENKGVTTEDKIAVAQAIHSSGAFEYCK